MEREEMIREKYSTNNGTVFVIGMQNFETNTVNVEINGHKGVCQMAEKDGEIGFIVKGEFVYFSHYMNGDKN